MLSLERAEGFERSVQHTGLTDPRALVRTNVPRIDNSSFFEVRASPAVV